MDVISDSRARPVLIVPDTDEIGIASAHALGIGTVPGIGACLDVLERATLAAANPSLFERLASMVGWW